MSAETTSDKETNHIHDLLSQATNLELEYQNIKRVILEETTSEFSAEMIAKKSFSHMSDTLKKIDQVLNQLEKLKVSDTYLAERISIKINSLKSIKPLLANFIYKTKKTTQT